MKLGVLIISGEFVCDEFATFSCGHCNRPKIVKHKERAEDLGGHCAVCWSLVCPTCAGGSCDPFEKKLERVEARGRALRSYGIG